MPNPLATFSYLKYILMIADSTTNRNKGKSAFEQGIMMSIQTAMMFGWYGELLLGPLIAPSSTSTEPTTLDGPGQPCIWRLT